MSRFILRLVAVALLLGGSACAPAPQRSAGRANRENFAKIIVGESRASEVLELLGPPSRRLSSRVRQGDEWGYRYSGIFERRMLWVWISADGIVRETSDTIDYELDRRYRY